MVGGGGGEDDDEDAVDAGHDGGLREVEAVDEADHEGVDADDHDEEAGVGEAVFHVEDAGDEKDAQGVGEEDDAGDFDDEDAVEVEICVEDV